MSNKPQPSLTWVYEGVWGLLGKLMCVPRDAPHLPVMDHEEIDSRKPAAGFLRYLKFEWAIAMAFLFLLAGGATIAIVANKNVGFSILAIPVWLSFFGLALVGYLAIYLRYDTTWYVFSDRSMRLRRGVWLIRESTITYENIQNVKVSQGPLQRFFGIANVVVETAGGGGATQEGAQGMHAGLIEGVSDAAEIRDSIMAKTRVAHTSGLGDEHDEASNQNSGKTAWTEAHLGVLSEIRELSAQLGR
ncbi:MAG: PH domain-containing protein [Rubripirellula sp.]|nr:PH domain-containing protein [Rubripirellula sp.]